MLHLALPNRRLFQCVFFIILSTATSRDSLDAIRCHPAERNALLNIQTPCKIDSISEINESTPDCCSWTAVNCDEQTGHVISLDLDSYLVNSTFLHNSPIFELRHLQKLTISDSLGTANLTCPIPSEIDKLTELRELNLGGFRGRIPSSIGNLSNLRTLRIWYGRLRGSLPYSMGNLKKLTLLQIVFNNLTGSIPESFGNLTQLTTAEFLGTRFSGKLPLFFFDLPNLELLNMWGNRIEGTFPQTLNLSPNLKQLTMSNMRLTGQLPSWLFAGSLETISLYDNRLSGSLGAIAIPIDSPLRNLDLSNNDLTGWPSGLLKVANLTYLQLSGNDLNGTFSLNDAKEMFSLDVSSNKGLALVNAGGDLPLYLQYVMLGGCNTKEFPNFLSAMDSLIRLNVSNNNMKGTIDFSSGWKYLRYLDASFNQLEGSLMAPPPGLDELLLSHNHLTGEIPANYCNTSALDLSYNNFSGPPFSCEKKHEILGSYVLYLLNKFLPSMLL